MGYSWTKYRGWRNWRRFPRFHGLELHFPRLFPTLSITTKFQTFYWKLTIFCYFTALNHYISDFIIRICMKILYLQIYFQRTWLDTRINFRIFFFLNSRYIMGGILLYKTFASPGKNCSPSKTKSWKIFHACLVMCVGVLALIWCLISDKWIWNDKVLAIWLTMVHIRKVEIRSCLYKLLKVLCICEVH